MNARSRRNFIIFTEWHILELFVSVGIQSSRNYLNHDLKSVLLIKFCIGEQLSCNQREKGYSHMKPTQLKTYDLTVWILPLNVIVLGTVDLCPPGDREVICRLKGRRISFAVSLAQHAYSVQHSHLMVSTSGCRLNLPISASTVHSALSTGG